MAITGDAAVTLNVMSSSAVIGITGSCDCEFQPLDSYADSMSIICEIYGMSCTTQLFTSWLLAAVTLELMEQSGEFGWFCASTMPQLESLSQFLTGIAMSGSVTLQELQALSEFGWFVQCLMNMESSATGDASIVMEAALVLMQLSAAGSSVSEIIGQVAVKLNNLGMAGNMDQEFYGFVAVFLEKMKSDGEFASRIMAVARMALMAMHATSDIAAHETPRALSAGLSMGCSAYLDNGPPAEVQLNYEEIKL